MQRHKLIWHLAARFVILSLAALLLLGWLAARAFDGALSQSAWTELEAAANLAAQEAAPIFASPSEAKTSELVSRAAQLSRVRLTLVLPDGKVMFDSRDNPQEMSPQSDRPEIAKALAGGVGRDIRYSATGNDRLMYLAVPVRSGGKILGVVRTAESSAEIESAYGAARQSLFFGIAIIGLAAGLVGIWLARRTAQPIENLRLGAERLAAGESSPRLSLPDIEELAALAGSLNRISKQLEERSLRIGRQGHEQEAVLASMVEGVLAVDSDERLITLNSAAAGLIGNSQADLQGRNLQEVLRNAELRRFVNRALQSSEPIEDDVVLHGEAERILRVRGTALLDGMGHGIGAVIVLNDVTHYRKLENLRRDFVANVSHELKTPIASIKGFVETLLDGALAHPDDARRFLEIIAKQTERLNNIIEDLLSLSKIEQSEEAADLSLADSSIRPVLETALAGCRAKASQREISLRLTCDETLAAPINSPLLEQAVINLIDNAIKYSDPGSEVEIEARADNNEVVIAVRDNGCGIAAEHLPRLFERFYRVDRARSRKLGGTGLGLAIVKHIVLAHHGNVDVESTPGEGSVFSIRLPQAVLTIAAV